MKRHRCHAAADSPGARARVPFSRRGLGGCVPIVLAEEFNPLCYRVPTGSLPTWLLRALARFDTSVRPALDFRAVLHPSTYHRVWRKTRALALPPDQYDSPLMRRPYDLRHAGVPWRFNAGSHRPR